MTTTPNMGLILPTDHGSAEVWDTILDAVFTAVDSHNHTTGQGVPIASAALRINADVSWSFSGTNYAITDLRAVDFAPVATSAVAGYAGALFVNSADSELYYRTTAGTNVKFTSGAALNVSAFTGGIGGDYSAVGALESFDDATDSYWLQQQGSPRPWAGLRVGNVDIYQQAASIVNRVRIQSPGALAASYALTLPAALPAASQMLTVGSSGTLAVDGALGNNVNITLAGTGYIKRGARTYTWPIMPTMVSVTGGTVSTVGSGVGATVNTSTTAYFPIHIPNADNDAITVTQVKVYHSVAGTGTVTWELDVSGQLSIAGFGPVTGASATGFSSPITLTPTTPLAGASNQVIWLKVVTPSTASGPVVQVVVTTTVP